MRRDIPIKEDPEGLMYDPTEAKMNGLHEELRLSFVGPDGRITELEVSPELMDAVMGATDLSVNVGPGESQTISLRVDYVYDYGFASDQAPEQPAETTAP